MLQARGRLGLIGLLPVPLLRAEVPYIGTGIESRAARDAADMILAADDGVIAEVDGNAITVDYKSQGRKVYRLLKFERSNQDTCINQKPFVAEGQKVSKGDPRALSWALVLRARIAYFANDPATVRVLAEQSLLAARERWRRSRRSRRCVV